jgi:type I restriction enzyme S subunit
MEVKPGYKQTEVGVIPEDWDAVPMQAITTHIGDGLHGTPVYSSNGDYFFINGNNLNTGKIVISGDTRLVDHSEFTKHRKPLSDRSILMSINGTIGNLGLFEGERVVLGKSAAYLNVKFGISRQFVYHSLQTSVVRRQFFNGLTGTTISNLGLATIRRTQIPLPPTDGEQRAIAEALSDVDGLLGGLDRLIAKKRDLKQAAMQQLLTGQTRLPGFHGEWKPKRFAELLKYERPDKFLVNSAEYLEKGDIPVLTANKSFILGYTNDDFGIYQSLPAIIFDDFTTDSKYVDFPFKVKSSAIKILKARSAEANLLFIFARMRLVNFPLGEHKRYYISEYQHIELPTPEPDEQIAIAEVLTDMDAELAAFEQRREKTRALKQAMVQELLTGKTRLLR